MLQSPARLSRATASQLPACGFLVACLTVAVVLLASASASAFEARITSGFGDKDGRIGAHPGIDIAAPDRSPVLAAAPGLVYEARKPIVIIWHIEARWFTVYAHLWDSDVSEGDHVDRGQRIGSVGTRGHNMRGVPYLHFELNSDGAVHADGEDVPGTDPAEYIVGCFDPTVAYPEDEGFVLTAPVACATFVR